jgi:hypothetical protein
MGWLDYLKVPGEVLGTTAAELADGLRDGIKTRWEGLLDYYVNDMTCSRHDNAVMFRNLRVLREGAEDTYDTYTVVIKPSEVDPMSRTMNP